MQDKTSLLVFHAEMPPNLYNRYNKWNAKQGLCFAEMPPTLYKAIISPNRSLNYNTNTQIFSSEKLPDRHRPARRRAPTAGQTLRDREGTGAGHGLHGMGLDDFCRLTLPEFAAALEAWRELREQADRAEWERVRLHACIVISPHVKGKTTPERLLPFPWEKKKPQGTSPAAKQQKPLSKEEALRRFEEMVGRMGG